MKTWQSILLGFICGVVLFVVLVISIGLNLVNKVEENYSDEFNATKQLLNESAPAVIQPSYLLAGLTLSPKFQEYLEVQIENGVWNTEYILQVLTDDVIPIYDENLKSMIVLSATNHIQEVENAVDKVNVVQDKVSFLVSTIKTKVSSIVSKINSLNILGIKHKINNTFNEVNSLINNIFNDLKNIYNKFNNISKDDIKKQIIDKVENSPYVNDFKKILSDIMDIVSNIEASIDDILNQINMTINVLLTDKDTNGKIFKEGDNIPGVGKLTKQEATILNAIDINIYGEYTKKNAFSGSIDIKSIDVTFENVDFGLSISTDKLLNDIENAISGTVSKVIYSSRGSNNGVLSIGLIYYNEIDNT